MGNFFGKSKPSSKVTEQDKAVLQLKQQRDKLIQYQKRIQIQLEKERNYAKQLLQSGKKDKAKLLLRKKRFQENMLTKTDGQLENIERMVSDIEFAQIESQVIQGLAKGKEALTNLNQLMKIEDVEKLLDDTQEAVAYQQEIDDLLAGGLSQKDESDVLAELDALTNVEDIKSVEMLPDVPAEKPKQEAESVKERQKEPILAQ